MDYKNTEIIMYQSVDGTTKIDVRIENETVWLSQAQMVDLFRATPHKESWWRRERNNVKIGI